MRFCCQLGILLLGILLCFLLNASQQFHLLMDGPVNSRVSVMDSGHVIVALFCPPEYIPELFKIQDGRVMSLFGMNSIFKYLLI